MVVEILSMREAFETNVFLSFANYLTKQVEGIYEEAKDGRDQGREGTKEAVERSYEI